ncbi:MAG: amidohydrolase [Hyphomicrobiales bacterium]|nr:amidohydrolase [Hyphomicrobiales bacterium]
MSQSGEPATAKPSIFGPPAIDCDVHIAVPSMRALMPYLDAYWYDSFTARAIDRTSFNMTGDAPNAPVSARPDWRPKDGRPGSDLSLLQSAALDTFGSSAAIANCIYGGIALHAVDMVAVICRAVNDWVREQWLDKEPRLRASILVPQNSPAHAVEEIERLAGDKRFVQVLMMAGNKELLGQRSQWPIYEAAARHGMTIGVHAGSIYHHPAATAFGSYQVEDYMAQAFAFESQVLSLVAEGVFQKFPDLKIVFLESGVTWLPACLWRVNKTWRGVRPETPWVKRLPADIVREHIRLTIQPFDAPDMAEGLQYWMDQMGSTDMLLFSTDFPHWHFEGTDAMPLAGASEVARKILFDNPLATYQRLEIPALEEARS